MSRFAVLALISLLVASPSVAGDLDFILKPDPGDDLQVLGHVMSEFFKPDPGELRRLYETFPEPEDVLAPALFLSGRFGKDLSSIIDLRAGGRSWNDIFIHFGVSPETVFVDLPREPGPPYGNAWGYWSKHGGRKHGKSFILSDREYVDWIHLLVTSEYYHLDPSDVAGMRTGGKTFTKIIGDKYREKHGMSKSGANKSSAKGKKGKDKKEDKGKGKGKGKEKR